MRVRDVSVGSTVLSLPDSMRVNHLSLEIMLSSVDAHHVTYALVTNTSGAPITFKQGVLLGTSEIFDPSSFKESSPLPVAGVSTELVNEDPSDVVAQLSPHVKKLDYPDDKSPLLMLLEKHRHAVALPGEPHGLTNRLTHHISLQPDAKPSFVSSYRLPHSQRQVVQQKVNELLDEGVIQESHSSWNSPLFLVSKKDGSYRPVIDFQKVSAPTVPDHYLVPILSDLLQSLEHFSAPLTLSQVSGKFPWMPNLGRSLPFPLLLATMNGFASPCDCEMHHLPFRGWSILSF